MLNVLLTRMEPGFISLRALAQRACMGAGDRNA
jgi:hypothetical protein